MNILQKSWSAIKDKSAENYLKGFGKGSENSKLIVSDILKNINTNNKKLKVIEYGCGNAQLLETLITENLDCHYTGVDFSEPLLNVAKNKFKEYDTSFIVDDAEKLKNISDKYDVGIYSHVIEMLSSPEESLFNAKKISDIIIIRFFEPPKFEFDRIELREMDVSEDKMIKEPYLRRKMSKDYYCFILQKLDCQKVEVYDDLTSKDEVHVLYFNKDFN